ncbi:DUF1573 domain-containing protein [Bacteroidota bacterium]
MKTKLLLSLLIVFLGASVVSAQIKEGKTKLAYANIKSTGPDVIAWNKLVHDFGEIKQNKPVTAVFELKNTGATTIIITNVKSSCGCTVPKFPKEPIAPGKSAKISAIYNAKTKGKFSKSINVFTNVTDKKSTLKIKGEVVL